MAISTRAKKTLQNELSRLKRERAVIDQDIKALETSLKTLGSDVARVVTRSPGKASSTKKTKKSSGSRPGRKSKRQSQILSKVQKNPGITVSEIADGLAGVKSPSALYPAVRRLVDDGKIKKQGKQLFPV